MAKHSFIIAYAEDVSEDLASLRAFERKRILNEIEKQLTYDATRVSKNRKMLVGLVPPWEYVEPVWELRVGEHRIFYDVDEEKSIVIIRAVRYKPPHKTTEEIL